MNSRTFEVTTVDFQISDFFIVFQIISYNQPAKQLMNVVPLSTGNTNSGTEN